tara:strand:+ start:5109 stop:5642 length:534 start_codon:yes stop_codon:yes gene_type:complete
MIGITMKDKDKGVWLEVEENAVLRLRNTLVCRVYLEPELIERLQEKVQEKMGPGEHRQVVKDCLLREEIQRHLSNLYFGGRRGTLFDHENEGLNSWYAAAGITGYDDVPNAEIGSDWSFTLKEDFENGDWDKHNLDTDLWAYLTEDGEGEFMTRDDITKRVVPVSDSVGLHVVGNAK